MKRWMFFLCFFLVVMNIERSLAVQQGRIYGKVYVRGREVFEGRIKWGDHETVWDDTFDGEREYFSKYKDYKEYYRERDEERRRKGGYLTAQTSFKFGRIEWIERKYHNSVIVKLKDGREIEMRTGDAEDEDITINDLDFGDVVVKWRRFERVEFMDEPESYTKSMKYQNYPLFGTVESEEGIKFRGYIMWDNDESLSDHILDGNDDKGFKMKIRFDRIAEIEKVSRSEVKVTLRSGRETFLRGSNDINDENRGIIVKDPEYGNVKLIWRDFYRAVFEEKYEPRRYSDFSASGHLYGTVYTITNDSLVGYIRWDDDEAYACDILNGEFENFVMEIEFEQIKEISRYSRRAVIVLLKSGKEIEMRDSNDVNDDNKGIIVLEGPDREIGEYVHWRDFARVVFRSKE